MINIAAMPLMQACVNAGLQWTSALELRQLIADDKIIVLAQERMFRRDAQAPDSTGSQEPQSLEFF